MCNNKNRLVFNKIQGFNNNINFLNNILKDKKYIYKVY